EPASACGLVEVDEDLRPTVTRSLPELDGGVCVLDVLRTVLRRLPHASHLLPRPVHGHACPGGHHVPPLEFESPESPGSRRPNIESPSRSAPCSAAVPARRRIARRRSTTQ